MLLTSGVMSIKCKQTHIISMTKLKLCMYVSLRKQARSEFQFACGVSDLEYCSEYKYLGVYLNVTTSARKEMSNIITRSN